MNRDAAVASAIVRVQSATDRTGDVMAEGNVSTESSEKMIFPAVVGSPDVKPGRPSVAGNSIDQNREDPCLGRPFNPQNELESEKQNGNPSQVAHVAGLSYLE
jgi:hypothetical protein